MNDNKKEPDMKDIAATAGKLFHEIKSVVTKMFHELKNKVPNSNDTKPTEGQPTPPVVPPKPPVNTDLPKEPIVDISPKVTKPPVDVVKNVDIVETDSSLKTDPKIAKVKPLKDNEETPK